jgi:hypothetical protein
MIRTSLSREDAQDLAIDALVFLTEDEKRLRIFLDITGLRPDSIREAARSSGFLAGVIDHLMTSEELLVAFTGSRGLAPEKVAEARRLLGSGAPEE